MLDTTALPGRATTTTTMVFDAASDSTSTLIHADLADRPQAPGPALFFDCGLAFLNDTPSFAGFAAQSYTRALGGHIGAHQNCNAEFPGSVMCTISDFDRANPLVAPPSSGAWISSDRTSTGVQAQNSCSGGGASWNNGVNDTGTNLNALGVSGNQVACTNQKPLACCQPR